LFPYIYNTIYNTFYHYPKAIDWAIAKGCVATRTLASLITVAFTVPPLIVAVPSVNVVADTLVKPLIVLFSVIVIVSVAETTAVILELPLAIVNISKSEYTVYMNRIKAREKQGDEIRSAVKEINSLKAELREIKNLIKGLGN